MSVKEHLQKPERRAEEDAGEAQKERDGDIGHGLAGLIDQEHEQDRQAGQGHPLEVFPPLFVDQRFHGESPDYLAVIVMCRSALADFEDLRAVACRRGVQATAVFTPVACDQPELATIRAGDARRPFLQHEHQEPPDPAKEEANECPADAAGAGKGIAAGQQPAANRAGRCRQHDQGEVAGNQSAWGLFKQGGAGDVIPAVLKIIEKHGLPGASLPAPPSAGSRDAPTRAAASVIGVTAPNNALAYEAAGLGRSRTLRWASS